MSECQCSIDVGDDCDAPEFYSSIDRKARVEHKCYECHRKINPGEKYRYTSCKWEAHIFTSKTCSDCESVRATFFCSSLSGSLWDDFEEAASENEGRFAQECINLLTPVAKRKVLDIIKEIRKELHEVMDD